MPEWTEEEKKRTVMAQAIPTFDHAIFEASVDGARIKPGGDLQITLVIPQAQKYQAIGLTDAVGIMVVIEARRKRRG